MPVTSENDMASLIQTAPPEPVFTGDTEAYIQHLKHFKVFLDLVPRGKGKQAVSKEALGPLLSSYYIPDQYMRRSAYGVVTYATTQRLDLRSRNRRNANQTPEKIFFSFDAEYAKLIGYYTAKEKLHGRTNKNPFNLVLRDFVKEGLLTDSSSVTSRYARALAYAHNLAVPPIWLIAFLEYAGGIDKAAILFDQGIYDLGWISPVLPDDCYLQSDGSLAGSQEIDG